MRRLTLVGLGFVLFISCASGTAGASSDPDMLQLVPETASVLVGINAAGSNRHPPKDRALIAAGSNILDYKDFISIVGANMSLREVVLVGVADAQGLIVQHSLLASGSFDEKAVFRYGGNAAVIHYRDQAVQIIDPFPREQAELHGPDGWQFSSLISRSLAHRRWCSCTWTACDPRLRAYPRSFRRLRRCASTMMTGSLFCATRSRSPRRLRSASSNRRSRNFCSTV